MRFDEGTRAHPQFSLDGGLPKGPKNIIRAANDPVRVPEDPFIVATLERCLCICTLGENCYIVNGPMGQKESIPYGAPMERWEQVCNGLLSIAMAGES